MRVFTSLHGRESTLRYCVTSYAPPGGTGSGRLRYAQEMAGPKDMTRRVLLSGVAGSAAAIGLATTMNDESEISAAPTRDRLPVLYLPHGGGPCFYMDWTMGPADTWDRMATWLRSIPATLPRRPAALVVVSAHWEASRPTVTSRPKPQLLFDYTGFPPHTYELEWPCPHAPAVAKRIVDLLDDVGLAPATDDERGLDHGVFVPLKLTFPQAEIPVVQLSLMRGLDPAAHLAMGRALAPLRDEGVFIVASGMSYHNMGRFGDPGALSESIAFDGWLTDAVTAAASRRDLLLADWESGPSARTCHPREEHLLPLMVAAGAAGDDKGTSAFTDEVMGARVSAYQFG